jgi:hypothetical protein
VTATRIVHVEEAVSWLRAHPAIPGASLVGSLPDRSEFPRLSLAEWKEWFIDAARATIESTPAEGATLFFQSDIKCDGEWVDKAYLCQKAAEAAGTRLVFHKIACRVPPGNVTFRRPGYTHLLAFSRTIEPPTALATADVLPVGEKDWPRGTGIEAARAICAFIRDVAKSRTLVNPFCGTGSLLAMANHLGLDAIGIEMSARRAERARALEVRADGSAWKRVVEEAYRPRT